MRSIHCCPRWASLARLFFALIIGQCGASAFAWQTKDYEVTKLANGVYAFVWTKPLDNPVEGNALFIINQSDVIVVDTGFYAETAEVMAVALKKLTPLPVRIVVNTHWHDDHHGGNAVYQSLWPGALIISHDVTRADIVDKTYAQRARSLEQTNESLARYQQWLREGRDDKGAAIDEGRRARIESLVSFFVSAIPRMGNLREAPPTLTFSDRLTLHRGERTIELTWLGLGNTQGDIVVHLPKEKIVATGDLLVLPIPFAFGSSYQEWPRTLAKLDAIDATILVPGHGPIQRDRHALRRVKALLEDLVSQVRTVAQSGATLEETLQRVTLDNWRAEFAGDDPARQRAFTSFVLRASIESLWKQFSPKASPTKPTEIK